MQKTISGTFAVTLAPDTSLSAATGAGLSVMTIDKEFSGPLSGKSQGAMMSFMSDVKGSAGYVAMERVDGTLEERRGQFVLQHSGTMDKGAAALSVSVVADSADGELVGLSGTMSIDIIDGVHNYTFEYTLPDA